MNYHRYLAPAEIAAVSGPAKATYNALLQYLETSGFSITHEYRHHLLVNFSGTIGQAERVFHVTINNYTAPDGRVFYANTTDPLVPSSLVGAIQSISGLNTATRLYHPQIARQMLSTLASKHNALTCPGPGPGTPNSYMTPNQTATAYNLNGLYSAGDHGEGQTVALFELDTFQMSDLTNYASCFGHAHPAIQTVVTGKGAVPSDSGVLEVELDAQLVLSAAPQLGILRIYEAANDPADYNAEWAQIIAPALVAQLSRQTPRELTTPKSCGIIFLKVTTLAALPGAVSANSGRCRHGKPDLVSVISTATVIASLPTCR